MVTPFFFVRVRLTHFVLAISLDPYGAMKLWVKVTDGLRSTPRFC